MREEYMQNQIKIGSCIRMIVRLNITFRGGPARGPTTAQQEVEMIREMSKGEEQ